MTSRHLDVRRCLTRWGLGVLWGVAAIATAAVAPSELPPLVQPPSGEHHSGKVIWADLITPDLAGAKRFYGGLFGWTFHDIHIGDRDYSVALLDGAPVGGLVQRTIRPGESRQPAWLTFISVRDVGEAERITLAHGGKVLSPPRTYAQRGRQAVFADPQGAVFAVLQSSSGDPQDVLAVPGEWIWSSLVTRDPDTDAAFYQAVFGYEVFDLPSDDGFEHVLLSTDNYARASSNALPPKASKLHPHWLNFVRVISTTDAVAKVEALGGRVLVAPHLDRHGGMVAVVADPAGAPFGLLEWTAADSKEVAK
jgi:predicted enzyme related to lactoylglutathione lyase